jgi:hypothetical protein
VKTRKKKKTKNHPLGAYTLAEDTELRRLRKEDWETT